MDRLYSELIKLPTFLERFRYLQLNGTVAAETFGFQRWLNQWFYNNEYWKAFRRDIIIRDQGRDLAMEGYEMQNGILVHHLNPITYDDIYLRRKCVVDPENVVCTQLQTHNAVHYGNESLLITAPIERVPNDTCPWKH